jgi:hypothetical protein
MKLNRLSIIFPKAEWEETESETMPAEGDFTKLPRDLQQFLMELQLRERIGDLKERYGSEFGELSS